MKISIETNIADKLAPPMLDRLLTHIVSILEKNTGLNFTINTNSAPVRLAHKAMLLRKKASRVESVAYDAGEGGFLVVAQDANGQTVTEEHSSVGFSLESNLFAAKTAAGNLAAELGVDPRYVYREPGIQK